MKKPYLKNTWNNFLLKVKNRKASRETLLQGLDIRVGVWKDKFKSILSFRMMADKGQPDNKQTSTKSIDQDQFMWI
jgi:hypothetical protein